VNLQAKTMAVEWEMPLPILPCATRRGCLVYLRTAYARHYRGDPGLLSLLTPPHRLCARWPFGAAQMNGPGHIRAIPIENNTEVEGHKAVTGSRAGSVPVRQRRTGTAGRHGLEDIPSAASRRA